MRNVVPGRLELPTSTLSVWRSNQLSYRTGFKLSEITTPSFIDSLFRKTESVSTRSMRASFKPSMLHCLFRYSDISLLRYSETLSTLITECWLRFTSPTLSRKEVFQPHLPVRLPCYDLAPITGFTLGRPSRSRTSGAPGFHGLTGGVYKARERIHRAMADARLLANPASWGRVADPNPN